MRVSDVFSGLEKAVAKGERYDVVAIFGLLYHIMDHFRLLSLVRSLGPKLIIVDSEFIKQQGALIRLVREKTDNPLNAAPQLEGQSVAIKGVPSRAAFALMAEALGYGCTWSDWGMLPVDQRGGVQDYYPTPDRNLRRGTCALRPL